MCVVTLSIRLVSGPAQSVGVAEGCGEIVEHSRQHRLEHEGRVGRLPGCNIAEIDAERRSLLLVADLRADDLERIEQTLRVLKDLRLSGGDRETVGRAAPTLVTSKPSVARLAGVDHIFLQEVVELSSACGSTVIVDGKTGIVTAPPAGSVKPMVPPMLYCVGPLAAAVLSGMKVNEMVPLL